MQMNLREYKALLLVVTATLALFVASPALQRLLVYPQTEFFTEMWLLGPEHQAEDFPFNITSNTNYRIYVGLGNHLGSYGFYSIQVKLRNQTQPAADSFARTPSSLPPLYSITALVLDKETWESMIIVSFDYTYIVDPDSAILSKVNVNSVTINSATLNLNGLSATWDPERSGFFVYLFFELWIYNEVPDGFQYNERFTSLRFNMTI